MGKKGQLTLHSLMIGLFTLVAAGVLLFGLSAIKDYQASSEKLDLTSFESSLSNMVKKASKAAFGSIEEQVTALPSGADAVCFVDRTKNISPLVNCRLNDMIKVYEDKNVFLSPFQEFTPIALDGFELDGQENPLCLKAGRGIIRLSASSKGSTAALSTFDPSVKQQDCTQMVFNGNPNSSLDIVFVGFGYTSADAFARDARQQADTLLATEPFSLNREKINIHRIDRFEDLGCTVGDYVKCDEFLVKKAASFCPNDFVIILVSRTKIADFLRPIRSSSVSNMAKINTADNPSVLLHEIGHALGGLADEYVDEQYYRNAGLNIPSFPNCDVSSCSKWAGIEGTGCFSGCSLNEFYRPTDNSIMRSLQVKRFGPRNEDILIKRLKKYSGAP